VEQEGLEARWQAERELVEKILAVRARLRQGAQVVEGTGSALERAAGAAAGTSAVGARGAAEEAGAAGAASAARAAGALGAARARGAAEVVDAVGAGRAADAVSAARRGGAANDARVGDAVKGAGADGAAVGPAGAAALTQAERAELLGELTALQGRLRELQGERPLILPSVDEQAVAAVVEDWTGVPVGRMVKNEIESVLNLADTLNQRVIGQQHALELIARRIQTSRAKLDNPNKPVGVFLLCGPSGVGKTETALTLAEALYGGEQNVITINMSEFQEAHTVSTLKGAPPGYV